MRLYIVKLCRWNKQAKAGYWRIIGGMITICRLISILFSVYVESLCQLMIKKASLLSGIRIKMFNLQWNNISI